MKNHTQLKDSSFSANENNVSTQLRASSNSLTKPTQRNMQSN
jgi:hypothetical protein